MLVVPFTLGNGRDCGDFDVSAVRAELDGATLMREADCDAGRVRIDGVMPGAYELAVFGTNPEGVDVMDSLATGMRTVHVVGDGTTVVAEPPLVLTAAPARILLRWDFDFGSCDSAGIERFELTAWRTDGSQLLLSTFLPCTMTSDQPGQYRSVPDIERRLSGDELGEVSVQALDEHGLEIGDPVLFGFQSPGSGYAVKLSVECDDGGCGGTGEADE
jgi:hypothetical protein